MRLGVAGALLAVALAAPGARADDAAPAKPTPKAIEEAEHAMERGVAAMDHGDPEAALAEYRRAESLLPDANLPYRFAGEALEALKRWPEAIASYDTYLRIKADVKDAQAIRDRIADIRARHVEGTLDVDCTPAGASVTIDDAASPIGATPVHDVHLIAGEHAVRVAAPDRREAVLRAVVTAGVRTSLQCDLSPAVVPPPPAPEPAPRLAPLQPIAEPPAADTKPVYARWWFWTGAAAVVAGGVVATLVVVNQSKLPPSDGGTHAFGR